MPWTRKIKSKRGQNLIGHTANAKQDSSIKKSISKKVNKSTQQLTNEANSFLERSRKRNARSCLATHKLDTESSPSQNKMSRGIVEERDEYFRCVDPLTKGIIYCINRLHLRTEGWCEEFHISDVARIDVTKIAPFESLAFTHDSMVDQRKIQKFVDMLIDFSCLIDDHLRRYGKVIVHCKNGRSRSPTVILGFMVLRGLGREHALQWLTTAFRDQRQTIARNSAEFPNFPKFASVIVALETRCSTESSRLKIEQRVDRNMSSFSSSSSSSSSSGSSSLQKLSICGKPWTKPFDYVSSRLRQATRQGLVASSYCSPFERPSNETNDQRRRSKRNRSQSKTPSTKAKMNITNRTDQGRLKKKIKKTTLICFLCRDKIDSNQHTRRQTSNYFNNSKWVSKAIEDDGMYCVTCQKTSKVRKLFDDIRLEYCAALKLYKETGERMPLEKLTDQIEQLTRRARTRTNMISLGLSIGWMNEKSFKKHRQMAREMECC